MKLAIIGSGPLAIFCGRYFNQIGAEVVLFQKNALGGNVRFLLEHQVDMPINLDTGKQTLEEFWRTELVPAITFLEENLLTRAGEVLRVHKRFLHPSETVPNRTRLHDLFRVIYSVNPRDAILKQLEENPEMFKQLGEQVINSLHAPVESFEDFDIVIEARGLGKDPLPMGPSNACALNEKNIKAAAELFYEKDIFTKLKLENKKHIVLVGNTDTAIMALLHCKDWLFENPEHTLAWISSTPVDAPRKSAWLNEKLNQILTDSALLFNNDKIEFEKKMYDWRDLEDYIKVKIPRPVEPRPKISFYEGYDVTSVDRLLDREGVFVTLETPDFRRCAIVPNDMKTIATDAILIACGFEADNTFAKGIIQDEPGYYTIESDNIRDGLMMIKTIEQKILSFFSRAK